MAWLRQLIEWQQEASGTEDFLESVKTDVFRDQVFVFTPRGDVRMMPTGSTPIDFAYRIHTDLGHHCTGARVNGRLLPLSTQLSNGDVVEIMRGRRSAGPSRDWLNPELRLPRIEPLAPEGAAVVPAPGAGRERGQRPRNARARTQAHGHRRPARRYPARLRLRELRGHARRDRLRRHLAAEPQQQAGGSRRGHRAGAGAFGPQRAAAARHAQRARARLGGHARHARALLRAAAGRRDHRLHHALAGRDRAPPRLPQHPQRRRAGAIRRVRLGAERRPLLGRRRGPRLGPRGPAARHQHVRRRPRT